MVLLQPQLISTGIVVRGDKTEPSDPDFSLEAAGTDVLCLVVSATHNRTRNRQRKITNERISKATDPERNDLSCTQMLHPE